MVVANKKAEDLELQVCNGTTTIPWRGPLLSQISAQVDCTCCYCDVETVWRDNNSAAKRSDIKSIVLCTRTACQRFHSMAFYDQAACTSLRSPRAMPSVGGSDVKLSGNVLCGAISAQRRGFDATASVIFSSNFVATVCVFSCFRLTGPSCTKQPHKEKGFPVWCGGLACTSTPSDSSEDELERRLIRCQISLMLWCLNGNKRL